MRVALFGCRVKNGGKSQYSGGENEGGRGKGGGEERREPTSACEEDGEKEEEEEDGEGDGGAWDGDVGEAEVGSGVGKERLRAIGDEDESDPGRGGNAGNDGCMRTQEGKEKRRVSSTGTGE